MVLKTHCIVNATECIHVCLHRLPSLHITNVMTSIATGPTTIVKLFPIQFRGGKSEC
jgi:hypothetical protein